MHADSWDLLSHLHKCADTERGKIQGPSVPSYPSIPSWNLVPSLYRPFVQRGLQTAPQFEHSV